MKRFKQIDCLISSLLIVAFTIAIILKQHHFFGETTMLAYFVVGGWQVISMIVHAITGYFVKLPGLRLFYHWLTVVAIGTMPIGSFWILIFMAPVMAIFYTSLCYHETYFKMKRPMDLLK